MFLTAHNGKNFWWEALPDNDIRYSKCIDCNYVVEAELSKLTQAEYYIIISPLFFFISVCLILFQKAMVQHIQVIIWPRCDYVILALYSHIGPRAKRGVPLGHIGTGVAISARGPIWLYSANMT